MRIEYVKNVEQKVVEQPIIADSATYALMDMTIIVLGFPNASGVGIYGGFIYL